jgi:hypothetical protein
MVGMPVGVDWETVLHLNRSICCACDGCTTCEHECRLPSDQAEARHEHMRAVGDHLMRNPLDESKAKICSRCDRYVDPRRIHRCASGELCNPRGDRLRRRTPTTRKVSPFINARLDMNSPFVN